MESVSTSCTGSRTGESAIPIIVVIIMVINTLEHFTESIVGHSGFLSGATMWTHLQ